MAKHSKASLWWLVPPFFFLAFVSFFYIGSKARNKIWTFCGFGYLFVFFLMMATDEEGFMGAYYDDVLMTFFLVGIIHAFWVRKEYQARMEIVDSEEFHEAEEAERLNRVKSRMMGHAPAAESKAEQVKRTMEARQSKSRTQTSTRKDDSEQTVINLVDITAKPKSEPTPNGPIDINSCSASEMASLPGVSLVMAKKAEKFRQENGGFDSTDQFFEVIQLKPHFVIQAQDLVVCQAAPRQDQQDPEPGGRKLDL